MRAGLLRDRVQVQKNVATIEDADALGDVLPRWETVAVRWANVQEQSGGESWQAQQVRADRSITVSMRYLAGLTPKHRLLFGGRILEIESVVNPDGMKVEHQLACREVI